MLNLKNKLIEKKSVNVPSIRIWKLKIEYTVDNLSLVWKFPT